MYHSVLRGVADSDKKQVQLIISSWQTSEDEFIPQDEWFEAEEQVQRALQLDPGNGFHHHQLARLYHLCMNKLLDCKQSEVAASAIARQHYQTAIQLSPSWPQYLAQYLLFKSHLEEFDEEFHQLVNKALIQAPRVPTVLKLLSHLALSQWSLFDQQEQKLLAAHIKRGLESPATGVRADIVQMLYSVESNAGPGVDDKVLDALAEYLLARAGRGRWDASYVELVFMFWPRWHQQDRLVMMDGLNAMIGKNNRFSGRMLNIAKKQHKLLIACANLKRTAQLMKACRDKSL